MGILIFCSKLFSYDESLTQLTHAFGRHRKFCVYGKIALTGVENHLQTNYWNRTSEERVCAKQIRFCYLVNLFVLKTHSRVDVGPMSHFFTFCLLTPEFVGVSKQNFIFE